MWRSVPMRSRWRSVPSQTWSKPVFVPSRLSQGQSLLLCTSQSACLLQMAVPGSLLSIMRYATSKGFSFPDETTEDDLSGGSFSGGGRESVLPVQHGQWIAEQASPQARREEHVWT